MDINGNSSNRIAEANDGYEDDMSFSTDQSRFRFPDSSHGTSQTAPTSRFIWPENMFPANGVKPQQESTAIKSFAEDREMLLDFYPDFYPSESGKNIWDIPSKIARNPVDQRSTSGSVDVQVISNSTPSLNAMGRPLFICSRKECHGKQFPRHSELQRHEDRHNRPFICPVSSCNNKDFADRGSLQRHSREVHKSAKYFCPIPQCERHKRGFGRKYNLIGHNRRVHRVGASNILSPISESASVMSYLQDEDRAHQSSSDGGTGLVDDEDDEADSQNTASTYTSSKAEKLGQQLRKLRAMKHEHDQAGEQLARDIQSVERHLLDAICNEG